MARVPKHIIPILKKKLQIDAEYPKVEAFDENGNITSHFLLGKLIEKVSKSTLFPENKNILEKKRSKVTLKNRWDKVFPYMKNKKPSRNAEDSIFKYELKKYVTTNQESIKNLFNYSGTQNPKTFNTVAWCLGFQCWAELDNTEIVTLKKLKKKFSSEKYEGYEIVLDEIESQLELLEDDKRSKEKKIPLKEVEDKEEQSQNPKLDYNFSYKHIENQSKLETLRILFIEKCCLESEDELKSIEYVLSVLDGFYSFFKDEVIDALTKVREIFQRNPKNYTHFSHFCPEYQKAFNKKGKVKFQIAKQSEINDFLIGKWQNIKPLTLDSIILYLGIDKVKFEEYYTKRIDSNYSPKNLRKQLEESVKNYPAKKGISKNVRYSLASILVLGLFSILFFTGIFDKFQKNTPPVTTTQQADINSIWESKDPDTFRLLITPFRAYSKKNNYEYEKLLYDRFKKIIAEDSLNIDIEFKHKEIDTLISSTQAKQVGKKYGADIVLWGDFLELNCNSKSKLCINYSLNENILTAKNFKLNQLEGSTGRMNLTTNQILALSNGYMQERIDNIIFWIIAISHFKAEEYDKSLIALQKIIREGECNYQFLLYAGMSSSYLNKVENSFDYFKSAINCALFDNAKKVLNINELVKLKTSTKKNHSQAVNVSLAWYNIGVLLARQDRDVEAIIVFDKSMEGFPKYASPLRAKARSFMALNMNNEALNAIDKYLEIYPNDIIQLNIKGYLELNLGYDEKALKSYKKALKLKNNDEETLINIGNYYRHLKNYKKALATYDGILKKNKNYIKALDAKGVLFILLKKYKKALAIYDNVLKIDSINSNAFAKKGYIYRELGDNMLAKHFLEKAIKNDSTNYTAKNNLGTILSKIGKPEEAFKFYTEGIKSKDKETKQFSWNNIAAIYLSKKKYNLAEKSVNSALKIDSTNITSLLLKGKILHKLKKYDNAKSVLNEALDIDGNNAEIWFHLGRIEVSNKDKSKESKNRALTFFNNALQINENHFFSLTNKAGILHQLDRKEEAKLILKKAIKHDSIYGNTFVIMGEWAFENQKYDVALNNFNKAIGINPNEQDFYMLKGDALISLQRYDEALKVYDNVYEKDTLNYFALFNKGLILSHLEKNKESLDIFIKLNNVIPETARMNNIIGTLYTKIGEPKNGKKHLFKALSLNENKFSYLGIGNCELILGNENKAIENYQKSLDLWNCSEEFFKDFDEDFQYIKSQNISKEYYQSIKQKLRDYCYNKKGVIKL